MATRGKEIVEDGATREEDIFGKRVRSSDDGDLTEDIKKRGRIGLENSVLGVEDMVIDEYFPPTCSSSNDLSETDITYTSWEMVEQKINVKILETEIMWRCLKFCLLFPKDYEIDREEIIQLWIAAGFFEIPPTREILENNVGRYFEEFERCHIFQASSFQYSSQRLRYRLNSSIVDLSRELLDCDYFRIHDFESHISERTLHSSFFDSRIDPFILKKLYQAKNLHTLLILHEPGSLLDQVPRELFLKLPFLRVLDLSHMNISELPSSIGKLKYLRYLNLSNTPLTALPNSVCGLYQMQTLKLRGCSKLVGLPKGFRKLINLQHLDLDIACLLVSMPPGIGDLRQLHSLSAFVVGKHDGCHITELKHMVNLGGTLRILRLENVCSTEEAKEAALDHKKYLNKLELEWSKLDDGLQLLENLQPHATIEELQIVGYGGVKFPSWIGDPVFSKLVTISIHNCRICKVLPPLGSLPLLFDLCVSEMYEVTVIDHQFCGRKTDIGSLELGRLELQPIYVNSSNAVNFNAFPRLGKLTLNGMPKLEKWSGVEEGDVPNLQKLSISGCSRLTTISKLSNFKSLLQLEISHCPSFIFLPKEELPENLGNLAIIDCLLLKELCHKEVEYDCGILKHIPDVWIDYKQISGTHLSPRTGSLHGNVPVHLTSAVGVGMGVGKYSSDAGISAKDQVSEEGKNDLVMSVPPTRRRRKGESKKVVCVPVPAAANSSSPSREFVHSDLWGWRKYGQKPIKGSPYPRGYYRCSTSKGCSARKQVERSLTDPNMLVITYTSEHNHPLPTQRNAIAGPTRSQSPKSSDAGAENYSSLPTDLESILQPDELRILQPDDIFTGFTDLELNLPADLNERVTSDQGKEH